MPHSGAGDFQFAVMAIGAPPAALDGSRKFDRLDGAQGNWPCLWVGVPGSYLFTKPRCIIAILLTDPRVGQG